MTHIHRLVLSTSSPVSVFSLSERLIFLALDADRAGLGVASEHLLHLASQILDDPASLRMDKP